MHIYVSVTTATFQPLLYSVWTLTTFNWIYRHMVIHLTTPVYGSHASHGMLTPDPGGNLAAGSVRRSDDRATSHNRESFIQTGCMDLQLGCFLLIQDDPERYTSRFLFHPIQPLSKHQKPKNGRSYRDRPNWLRLQSTKLYKLKGELPPNRLFPLSPY